MEQQAESIGIPLYTVRTSEMPSMDEYNRTMLATMSGLKQQGIEYSIFGDIFLEDLKTCREGQLAKAGITGVFPIWKRPTNQVNKGIY